MPPDAPTEDLGAYLMAEITKVVPVLPVPLVAAALAGTPRRSRRAGRRGRLRCRRGFRRQGAVMKLPPQGLQATLAEGLAPLIKRGLVDADLRITQGSAALLAFYAAPVAATAGGKCRRIAATRRT